ncbi:MAG TPA: hypothetical protein V6C81_28190 [Planktothrix sp.]|jgi:hypothetical protein
MQNGSGTPGASQLVSENTSQTKKQRIHVKIDPQEVLAQALKRLPQARELNVPVLVDQEVVSILSGYRVKTLERHRCSGEGFPYRKVGGAILYDLRDVVDRLEEAPKFDTK